MPEVNYYRSSSYSFYIKMNSFLNITIDEKRKDINTYESIVESIHCFLSDKKNYYRDLEHYTLIANKSLVFYTFIDNQIVKIDSIKLTSQYLIINTNNYKLIYRFNELKHIKCIYDSETNHRCFFNIKTEKDKKSMYLELLFFVTDKKDFDIIETRAMFENRNEYLTTLQRR